MDCYFNGAPEEWLEMKDKEVKEILDRFRREGCIEVSNLGFIANSD